jgi:hypothetical protein
MILNFKSLKDLYTYFHLYFIIEIVHALLILPKEKKLAYKGDLEYVANSHGSGLLMKVAPPPPPGQEVCNQNGEFCPGDGLLIGNLNDVRG